MRFARIAAACLMLVMFAIIPALYAQTPTAIVNGTVLDTTGATVPGASVSLTNQETSIVSQTNTNSAGFFLFLNLLPDHYTLTVSKDGFKTISVPAFELVVNQTLTQKLTLEVGTTTQTVEVKANDVGQMIQRSTTELGTIIDEQQMHELPLNGRNFTELLILQPGMNPVNTAQGGNGIGSADGGNIGIPNTVVYRVSANGAGNRSNMYYLDGIINTDDRGGGWSVPPIADTIQEFKVQGHNDDAQYSDVLGVVVNIATKSGTNNFHGDAWEFARSNIFDARNPFTGFCTTATCPTLANSLATQVSAGSITAAQAATTLSTTGVSPLGYSQNEYGGTFGGPIFKNKTFFYVAYEGWHYSQPTNSFVVDPTAAELTGDFSGAVSPELIGTVNSSKTGITPNQIYNPFAETGASMAVPFTCTGPLVAGSTQTPEPLMNPGAAFGSAGYGVQVPGGTPCNVIPSALIDSKLAAVIKSYTAPELANCSFTPNYTFAVDNCLDSRPTTNVANNVDLRIDHHFSSKNTVFARAYMMWDVGTGLEAGTTSLAPSPYHVLNIGGAWDHIFSSHLILEIRGGINSRPVVVNPTNSAGSSPESTAGFSNLDVTSGFYLSPSGYPGVIGNVGPEHRANPEHDIDGALTWVRGSHTIKMGGQFLYENRLETNQYEQFSSSTAQTCPTNASSLFACGSGQGNGLASMLLDVPSALTVNLPQFEEVHVAMMPFGGFIQDSWHIKPNLTLNFGFRYDYDPAVKLLVSDGETVNALNLPAKDFIIGSSETAAYTTGCASTVVPPCVPGGLTSTNPAFQVTVGGITYNTLNNITFSPNQQPGLKAIRDNVGPRLGLAWSFLPNTVLRVGYGIYYDPIGYRSQYAENMLQGSVWPWTRGVADTLNTAPIGTAGSPTVNPICNSAASCGPYGGYTTSNLTNLVGSNPIVVAPTPWGSTFGGYTVDPSYSDPRSQQWNVQIERQLSPSTMVSIAYVGSSTTRLEWCCKANYPQGGPFCVNNAAQGYTCPGNTSLTQAQILQNEYMPFAAQGWNYSESTGYSNYNALEAQFQKRFSGGLEVLAAYTWEKALGDSNGDFNAENGSQGAPYEYYFAPQLSKGPLAFNIPQVFNLSSVYDIPFGPGKKWLTHGWLSQVLGNWETNFSFIARSGQNFNPSWGGSGTECSLTVTASCVPSSVGGVAVTSTDPANLSDSAGAITGYSRPSLLPNCTVTGNQQSATQWFNPTCFVSPSSLLVGPGYGFGDAGIGNLRSMWYNDTDVALIKKISVGDRYTIQLRVEGFNVFNHVVLAPPSASIAPTISGGVLSYGTAGQVTSIASTPRELQLAVKFIF
jgi:hypothetical protein